MMISIIIPTLNEERDVGRLVHHLRQNSQTSVAEIIVCDGGSTDRTLEVAAAAGARIVISKLSGRAFQMNEGASIAVGDILYFIHADTIPPVSYAGDIIVAVKTGFDFGRYRTKFESDSILLKVNAFFTRFDWFVCYGGDQTFFIRKDLFKLLNGYDERLMIMEEYDLTVRAKKLGEYKILSKTSLISARKYEQNSWWQVQRANLIIVKLYKKGIAQDMLVKRYHELIRYP